MKNTSSSNKTILIYVVLAVIVILAVGAFSLQNSKNDTDSSTYSLEPSQAVSITEARLVAAKNALDGSGEFSEELCEQLGKLALDFDPSSDFISCSSPKILYLATPDTANNQVLTISDDIYTSSFTTDSEFDYLLDYSFSRETSGGFNSYGGRE